MDSWVRLADRATLTVPVILCMGCLLLLLKKRPAQAYQRFIFAYLVMALAFDVGTRWWVRYQSNNLVFVTLFGMGELVVFSLLYIRYFLVTYRKVALSLAVVITAFSGTECLLSMYGSAKDVAMYQTYGRSAVAFTIVCYGMLFAVESLGDALTVHRHLFRLNVAVVLYFALNFLFYLPINFVVSASTPWKYLLWMGNLLVLVAFYSYLLRHLWRFGKDRKRSSCGSQLWCCL